MMPIVYFILILSKNLIQCNKNPEVAVIYDFTNCSSAEGLAGLKNIDIRARTLEKIANRLASFKSIHSLEYLYETSVELQGEYLSHIEIDIIKVPEFVNVDEFKVLTEDIPCIKSVLDDDVRYSENSMLIEYDNLTESTYFRDDQWSLLNLPNYSIHANIMHQILDNYAKKNNFKPTKTVVAVIDSGCNVNHKNLLTSFWRNQNETHCNDGIDNDHNGFVDDCKGWNFYGKNNLINSSKLNDHGTICSGLIAAQRTDNDHIAGICPTCEIMCIKFMDNNEGSAINEIKAINYAISFKVKISNNSYGSYITKMKSLEKEAIERASNHNHLFIASAGNSGINLDNYKYIHVPSGYKSDNIISVGSVNFDGRISEFSNYGKNSVDVFAPGNNIVSTCTSGYSQSKGTSFATPHVVGIAGYIWSFFPNLTYHEIKTIILHSCQPGTNAEKFSGCKGVIDSKRAAINAIRLNEYKKNLSDPESYKCDRTNCFEEIYLDNDESSDINKITDVQNLYYWAKPKHDNDNYYSIPSSSITQFIPLTKTILKVPVQTITDITRKIRSAFYFL